MGWLVKKSNIRRERQSSGPDHRPLQQGGGRSGVRGGSVRKFTLSGHPASPGAQAKSVRACSMASGCVVPGKSPGLEGRGTAQKVRAVIALKAEHQTCIIHLIRNTFRLASKKDWDALRRDVKPIYSAVNAAAARAALRSSRSGGAGTTGRSCGSGRTHGRSSLRSWTTTWKSGA